MAIYNDLNYTYIDSFEYKKTTHTHNFNTTICVNL